MERIVQIKDYKRLNADAAVSTTHFIKKSVMIPCDEEVENGGK
jgi:hypothetical protein